MNVLSLMWVLILLSSVGFAVMKLEYFLEQCDKFSEESSSARKDIIKEMWK